MTERLRLHYMTSCDNLRLVITDFRPTETLTSKVITCIFRIRGIGVNMQHFQMTYSILDKENVPKHEHDVLKKIICSCRASVM